MRAIRACKLICFTPGLLSFWKKRESSCLSFEVLRFMAIWAKQVDVVGRSVTRIVVFVMNLEYLWDLVIATLGASIFEAYSSSLPLKRKLAIGFERNLGFLEGYRAIIGTEPSSGNSSSASNSLTTVFAKFRHTIGSPFRCHCSDKRQTKLRKTLLPTKFTRPLFRLFVNNPTSFADNIIAYRHILIVPEGMW